MDRINMVDQWIAGVPLIEIDVDTLEQDGALMQFYNNLIMLVCGKEKVENLNVCQFSEYVDFNFPHDPADKGYFVRFQKRINSITILVMSGNLFFECFQVNRGIVYVFGNDQIRTYERNCQAYTTKVSDYELKMQVYVEEVKRALESGDNKKVRKPKQPKNPKLPYIYQCLRYYGLNAYQNLRIGSSYPDLQLMALKNRNEILFGMNSLNGLFDKLLNFGPTDTKTGAECGLFGAVFVSESIRLLEQATEMENFFRDKVDRPISERNWKMHLVWSFASKVLRLKHDEEARGVQRTHRYQVLVGGVLLDENDLERMFWTLKYGDIDVKDDDYLSGTTFDLDRKSLKFK